MKICKKGLAAALIIFLSFSCVLAKDLSSLPDFELEDMAGRKITLSSFKNKKPVILFFWTTWCSFCRKELNLFNDVYAALLEDGVELLSINVGESRSQIERFLKNKYLVYPILLDKNTKVAYLFDVLGVPTYVIINKDGNVVYKDNYFPYEEYKDLIDGSDK